MTTPLLGGMDEYLAQLCPAATSIYFRIGRPGLALRSEISPCTQARQLILCQRLTRQQVSQSLRVTGTSLIQNRRCLV